MDFIKILPPNDNSVLVRHTTYSERKQLGSVGNTELKHFNSEIRYLQNLDLEWTQRLIDCIFDEIVL